MNFIFAIIMIISGGFILIKDPQIVLPLLTDSSTKAVDLSLRLLSIYAIWMGILQVCEDTGVSKLLAKALSPIIKLLFGELPQKTQNFVSINMSANILGMGNAATPAAISAINSMYQDSFGKKPQKLLPNATASMIMLVVLNATSLQLIPTSIISLRTSFGSANASDIILTSLITSTISTILGVVLVKVFCKKASHH